MRRIRNIIKILFSEGPIAILRKLKARQMRKRFQGDLQKLHLISEAERLNQRSKKFDKPEVFSILTPLYNTPTEYLIELLDSMEKQTYKYWELCLADGSDDAHSEVGKICQQYEAKDSRIKYVKLEENKGISDNTNACLSLATGSYIGLLDHDDILHESALYEVMCTIDLTGADFLYTDEVKFTDDFTKIRDITAFNFKPRYGKDELRAHNYICHFTVFSRALLEKEGRLYRKGFDGSQDHDMVLRLTEIAECIAHIPKVLYYWRVHEESVSLTVNNKLYAVDAAIRAIEEQLERQKEPGEVKSNLPYQTIYRINYKVEAPDSISTIVYDTIIDEGDINVLNQRATEAEGKHLMFLHSDVKMDSENWLVEMLMYAQRSDVGCVGGKILYPDNNICFAGIALDAQAEAKVKRICHGMPDEYQGYEAMLRHVRNTTAVWLGCFMIEREKFISLGGLNIQMGMLADVDLALGAIEKGFCNVWTPFAHGKYYGSEEEVDYKKGNISLFEKKWQMQLNRGDDFCHPVLKENNLI